MHGPDEVVDVSMLRAQRQLLVDLGSLAVSGSVGLAELLRTACSHACAGTAVPRAKLMVYELETDSLVIESQVGWGPDVNRERTRSDVRSPAGWTLRNDAPLWIPDVTREPSFDRVAPLDRYGIVSLINVPISLQGRALGVLEIDSQERLAVGADLIPFMQGLAAIVAGALLRKEREERYRGLFESIEAGFCIIELRLDASGRAIDYRFVELNPAFERLTGLAGATGRWLRELQPLHDASWLARCGAVARTGVPERFEDKALNDRWYSMHAFRLHGDAGRRVGVLLSDITDSKEAEMRLRESEGRLRVALDAASMGTWIWQLTPDDHWVLDEGMRALLAIRQPKPWFSLSEVLANVHDEDRERVRDAFERSARERAEIRLEFRVNHGDGRICWLHDQGRMVTDDRGTPLFMAGAGVDITERKETEARLVRADRAKSEFLAMLAHELRNPMAAVSNAVGILQRANADATQKKHAVSILRRQTDQLSRIVGDLLEVSRIEQGRIQLYPVSMALVSALASAAEMVQPMMDARRQQLVAILPDPSLRIVADPARIAQIIANLLHNASKFSPEGADVELFVSAGSEIQIVVRDQGSGIAADVLPRIFDLFEQGERTLARSEGGLGIGLALARRLAEMHGGSIAASSDGPGMGSTFVVRLPRGEGKDP